MVTQEQPSDQKLKPATRLRLKKLKQVLHGQRQLHRGKENVVCLKRIFKNQGPCAVAHICNPSYSEEGGSQFKTSTDKELGRPASQQKSLV
jgi:hypothetical protein